MLNIKSIKPKEEGFTIIEVLIVLAIAALILLIVFLAVPALQRSSRNNSRKNDAARVSTAIANYASNNNGLLPQAATWTAGANATCPTIAKDIGQLSEYGTGTPSLSAWCSSAASAPTMPKQLFEEYDGPAAAGGTVVAYPNNTFDGLLVFEQAVCPTTNAVGPTISVTAGTSRQAAIIYTQETSSGSWNEACIQAT